MTSFGLLLPTREALLRSATPDFGEILERGSLRRQRARITDKGRDARHRAQEQMVGPAACPVEQEPAACVFPEAEHVANSQAIQERRQLARRHELEEKLELGLGG